MTRKRLLERWVDQPPAEPVIQYLRDAEREAATDMLAGRDRVLDIASEAATAAGLDADEVVRVDFSAVARDRAREALADTAAAGFHAVDPESPELPFPDNSFDGAVSLGPYDWKFLDVERLTAEVKRVLSPEGRYVFSVPTPRSPYHVGGKSTLRYYTPEAARSLVFPGWELVDRELVYQYHFRVHDQVRGLADGLQRRFVALAERLTGLHTDLGLWNNASYLVLGVEPTDYDAYRERALARLFTSVGEGGCWEPGGRPSGTETHRNDVPTGDVAAADSREVSDRGHLIRGLSYELDDDGTPVWSPIREQRWRYAPFALAGLLYWRAAPAGHDAFDEQLQEQLAYFEDAVETQLDAMGSYAVGPLTSGFALAAETFEERDRWLDTARTLFADARDRFGFDVPEDALLPFGWADLYDATGADAVRDETERALWALAERQAPDGLFAFDGETAARHQNQMYTVWGLCRAVQVTGLDAFLDDAERAIEYAIHERMRSDGAFVWEDVSGPRRLKITLARRLGSATDVPHWELLYSCHQTFFVNAVAAYYAAGGDRDYDEAVGRAMNWVVRTNDLGQSLVELSEIDLPMRFLTTGGSYAEPTHQRYKGVYETGSWILALTHLTDDGLFGPAARRARRRSEPRRQSPRLLD